MEWLMGALGLVILLLAGDALVKGAVNLSLRVGIPALIVSLTIVAFGTSAPELLISITAALEGVPGIAVGNVVGSNTANVLLVLGVPALLATMHTSECNTRKSYVLMMAGSVLFVALAFFGQFTWVSGVVLLLALALVLGDAVRDARAHRAAGQLVEADEPEGADPDMPWWKICMFLALGLVGLPLGANLLLDSAVTIARTFGLSESVIGLTMVAIGTSVPELATTVMAALRRQADVALGNVIGSNMFNLLAIIGIASMVSPIPVDPEFLHFDLWVMLGASALLFPFVFLKRDITRIWGVVLTLLYVSYVMSVLS
ncbi:calcium/sodium antiporter [Thalassovita taeanensis]|uniref:Cation:H+ antiporter n=1 Tax=Thalassovita taeanensis TaxID=657014 RepID=A0A1H9DLU9_9RHOB|nr:calcium/sodium antiporter [Thalassovita taeanensis]SEQ14444.1 cation:H+ antiporter [Thalassovita taeanensis]